jgi:peptidoglycan/LPS O-acetylase OafA/YrhL
MMCAVPVLWVAIAYVTQIKRPEANAYDYLGVSGGYALVALSCCLAIVAAQRLTVPAFTVWLGTISYGLYVFHAPALALTERLLRGSTPTPAFDWRIALALTLTILCAALSYRYVELPFLKLKRRFEVVHSRPAEIAVTSHGRTRPLQWVARDVKRRLRECAAAWSVVRTGDRRPSS